MNNYKINEIIRNKDLSDDSNDENKNDILNDLIDKW